MTPRLNILAHDLRWLWWKLRNPGRPYGAFYADYIARRIAGGERHPSLSQAPRDPALYEAGARRRVDFLREQGLTPSTRFVDYGCGGLRLGKQLIPYLDPGCYRGVDVASHFFREGLDSLDPELVAERAPRVAVISPDELAALRAFEPDMVYAGGVLYHVPPGEVARFLRELGSILGPATRCLVTARLGRDGARLGFMRWSYALDRLRPLIESLGLQVDVMDDPVAPVKDPGTRNVVLVIRRGEGAGR